MERDDTGLGIAIQVRRYRTDSVPEMGGKQYGHYCRIFVNAPRIVANCWHGTDHVVKYGSSEALVKYVTVLLSKDSF